MTVPSSMPRGFSQTGRPPLRIVARPTSESSEEMVIAAFEREVPDFGVLFYDYLKASVERALRSVLGERTAEHEDLVQATFEKVLITLSKGQFRRECSLRTWASAVATRTALNAIRSRRTARRYFPRSVDDGGSRVPEPSISPEVRLEKRDVLRLVREELSRMSPARAEALVMADVLGHDHEQVAEALDISVAAAQSRVVRGRAELRERLLTRGVDPKELEP